MTAKNRRQEACSLLNSMLSRLSDRHALRREKGRAEIAQFHFRILRSSIIAL